MNLRKNSILFLCILVILTFLKSSYDYNLAVQYADNLNQSISMQIKQIDEEIENWQQAIEELYWINMSHTNCVSMAMLMNDKVVLAETYDRDEMEQIKLYKNDKNFSNFYGRFYVPEAKIDVALYKGYAQEICDRQDSANIYSFGLDEGKTIADHNNQEFSKLYSVKIGTLGYIQLASGDIINIKCIDVFNGHNNGVYITDENEKNVMNVSDFMTYTCRDNWRNVRICLWEKY